jgi:hypothetical protein
MARTACLSALKQLSKRLQTLPNLQESLQASVLYARKASIPPTRLNLPPGQDQPATVIDREPREDGTLVG